MKTFLECQDFITEVRITYPKSPLEANETMRALWRPETYDVGLRTVLGNSGVQPEQVVDTTPGFKYSVNYENDIPIARNLNLPEDVRLWAKQIMDSLPRPCIIVQPYSFRTNPLTGHWPYWSELLNWILHDFGKHYVLVGHGWDDSKYHGMSNITCMVGKTPSMMHVFALAELADAIITTSNSLGHFCVSQRLKTAVCAARGSSDPKWYWNKIVNGDDVKVFSFFSKVQTVCFSMKELFDIWPTRLPTSYV